MKEFRLILLSGGLFGVEWHGCDGRLVATCAKKYEAVGIVDALNECGMAKRWYKRAATALGMKEREPR